MFESKHSSTSNSAPVVGTLCGKLVAAARTHFEEVKGIRNCDSIGIVLGEVGRIGREIFFDVMGIPGDATLRPPLAIATPRRPVNQECIFSSDQTKYYANYQPEIRVRSYQYKSESQNITDFGSRGPL